MADLIVNHVSIDSAQFTDWRLHGDASVHRSMFLSPVDVFGGRTPTAEERAVIYRPRPTPPFHEVEFADGSVRTVWSTFTHQQIDIDVEHEAGWDYLINILDRFREGNVGSVRLDAVGYAIKRAGTSCFMIPETYEFIDRLANAARARGMDVLVEVHGYHQDQIEVAGRVDRVYDFALPPLAIDALTTGDAEPLRSWIGMRPNERHQRARHARRHRRHRRRRRPARSLTTGPAAARPNPRSGRGNPRPLERRESPGDRCRRRRTSTCTR